MSTLTLARLLFAITSATHFFFVALTLGLATLVAIMQTRAAMTGDEVRGRMVRHWGQLYVINYAVGIVTGLLMEFQFGLNWPGLTTMAGDVFGAPLAMETLIAFFIESTFLGLWIFGWDRLNRWAHLALIWIVTLTAYASAYFVMVANGFLRHPVGYQRVGNVLRIDNTAKLFTNPMALVPFGHIVTAAFLVAGFFMAAMSARHLRRARIGANPRTDLVFYRRSLRVGLASAAVAIVPAGVFGGLQFPFMADNPGKPAWADVMGEIMMFAWLWMFVVAILALVYLPSARRILGGGVFQRIVIVTMPVPYLAMLAGWLFREGGRQPWLIYGILRTEDAVRPMGAPATIASFAGVTALFLVLLALNFRLLRRFADRGPDATGLGAPPPDEPASPAPVPTF